MKAVRMSGIVQQAPRTAIPEVGTLVVFADRDRVERCLRLLENAGFEAIVGPFFASIPSSPELLQTRHSTSAGPALVEWRRERYGFGDVRIDVPAYEVLRAGARVRLSALEFDLLVMLARARGTVVPISDLRRVLRETTRIGNISHCLRTHVGNLRRKLEPEPKRPRHLLNVRRRGYRLADVRPAD